MRLPDKKEFDGLLRGARLGRGAGRKVFEYRLDKSLVIKYEMTDGSYQNIMEWEVWETVQWIDDLSKWFAPCEHMSANGQILIQKRTFPIRKEDLPSEVPELFTDLKIQNWGWLDGRPVCHDYGTVMTGLVNAMEKKGMQKVTWWGNTAFEKKMDMKVKTVELPHRPSFIPS